MVGILCLFKLDGRGNARRVSNAKACVKGVETAVNKAACSSCELSGKDLRKTDRRTERQDLHIISLTAKDFGMRLVSQ